MLIATVMLSVLNACQKEISVDIKNYEKDYTIDGQISDQPGPYTVKISWSAAYSTDGKSLNLPVNNASVRVSDDLGEKYFFHPSGSGDYASGSAFRGKVNRTYTLHIETQNGDVIESSPELLNPTPPVKNYYYQLVPSGPYTPEGHEVYLSFVDPGDQVNYYRWEWYGVYMFSTEFAQYPNNSSCWRYEYDYNDLHIMSDKFFNGNEVTLEVTLVPFFSTDQYLVTVSLESLTADAYQYWQQVNAQITNTGGSLDPPPSRILGNLHCINDPLKNVLGFFQVSSIIKQPILIIRSNSGRPDRRLERTYPNVPCWEINNSYRVLPDTTTWPVGWH